MHKNSSSLPCKIYRSILFLGLLTVAQPAWAGFQWIAPSGGADQAPVTSLPSSPSPAPVTTSPATENWPAPQVIEGTRLPPSTPGLEAASPSRFQDTISRTKVADKDDTVRGFADNVPLSVALRQVLPQEIGFSVAQDVSLGTLVSWKGGAPWRQVMKDMLAPAGLAIKEQGKIVQVVRSAEGPTLSLPSSMSSSEAAAPSSFDSKPTTLLPPASNTLPSAPAPERHTGSFLTPPPSSSSSLPSSLSSPYVMEKSVDAWTANKGETLQKVLEGWCRRSHVELSWRAEYDYPLQASVSFTGSFEDAVRSLLIGFQEAKPQPIGYLYNNQLAGQTVLVVQTRGNTYNE